jgi:hypothetical protein
MKKIPILSLVLLLLFSFAQAQTVPAVTGSLVSQQEAQEALDFHNKVRKEVNVAPLTWSAELSAYAQAWADNLASTGCKMQHRPYSGKWAQQYGENIYWALGRELEPVNASSSWYSEIKDYKHGPLSNNNFMKVGHYTQMVWHDSKRVGMGKATCKNGSVIIVANYDPRGNMLGTKAYE